MVKIKSLDKLEKELEEVQKRAEVRLLSISQIQAELEHAEEQLKSAKIPKTSWDGIVYKSERGKSSVSSRGKAYTNFTAIFLKGGWTVEVSRDNKFECRRIELTEEAMMARPKYINL